MKILEIFEKIERNLMKKCMLLKIWWLISIGQLKPSTVPAKASAFAPIMMSLLKDFENILRFFDQKLFLRNLTFFTIFTKYLLDFWLRSDSDSDSLWKITPDFYNNFPISVGTFRRSPSPSRRYCIYKKYVYVQICTSVVLLQYADYFRHIM